jgi:hypothetical protein
MNKKQPTKHEKASNGVCLIFVATDGIYVPEYYPIVAGSGGEWETLC